MSYSTRKVIHFQEDAGLLKPMKKPVNMVVIALMM
jgi:hypothetical protein